MRHMPILIAAVCLVAASAVPAQALRDPTRPPAAISKGAIAAHAEPSGWILQSVLISPERRYAIINGEVVPLGGSIAGAELVAVATERVTLRTPEGLRVVHLFPDVVRLGADEGNATAKRMVAPKVPKDTKDQGSGSSRKKK
jgi:MSHA biogenesis protein MshK